MKNKSSSQWGHSLRVLSWDSEESLSNTETLISDTVHGWYDKKHKEETESEIRLINSIPIDHCPYCNGTSVVKCGHTAEGIQRYLCKNDGKKFNPLTGTVFENKKIPITEWIAYLLSIFEFHSIRSTSRDNRNAGSTGKYWLKKVFAILEDCQKEVILSGNVYIDEIFFSVVSRKVVEKNGKKLRGISRNKICVMVGMDDSHHIVISVENTSKPSSKSTWAALGSHIEGNSHLIHDGEHSHSVLVNGLNLTEEVHTVEETKNLEDKDNPLDPINNLHPLIKRFMREHGGFKREELQDWMNLVWFVLSEPENRYDKVKIFIEKAIMSPRKVKYRDVMSKKDTVYRN